jgi:dihydroneopterin aldolase
LFGFSGLLTKVQNDFSRRIFALFKIGFRNNKINFALPDKSKQMALIEIEGMEFYAFHGHFAVEKVAGNRFIVDLKIEADVSLAGQTDRLEDTLDYSRAYQLVKEEMGKPSDLLENIACRIISRVRSEFPAAEKVWVKVSKMNPPMGGPIEKVSVSFSG